MSTRITKRSILVVTLLVVLVMPGVAFGHGVEGEPTTTKLGSVCYENDTCANTFDADSSGAVEGRLSILTARWQPLMSGPFESAQWFEARYRKTVSVRGARSVTAETTWNFNGTATAIGDAEAFCVVRTGGRGAGVLGAAGLPWPPDPSASMDTVNEEITLTTTLDVPPSTKQVSLWTELVCAVRARPFASRVTLEMLSGSGLTHFHVNRT